MKNGVDNPHLQINDRILNVVSGSHTVECDQSHVITISVEHFQFFG